jgi:hypothetical protein
MVEYADKTAEREVRICENRERKFTDCNTFHALKCVAFHRS